MKYREKSNCIFVVIFMFGGIIVFGGLIHVVLQSPSVKLYPTYYGNLGISCNNSSTIPSSEMESLRNQLVDRENTIAILRKSLDANAVDKVSSAANLVNSLPAQSAIVNALEATYKSCLDSNCLQATVKQADGQELQRIGLLIPDPYFYHQLLVNKLQEFPNKDIPKNFAFSSHVPPYGYGKNHGWTKIIRLVENIPYQAYRLLKNYRSSNEKEWDIMYGTQVRQIARWHCRLNHVAAHTSMLTIFVDDFFTRPHFTLQMLFSYAGFKPNKAELDFMVSTVIPELKKYWKPDGDLLPKRVLEIAETALSDEISTSQTFQKWPCANFLELEKTIILPTIRYFQLSANCSDSFTKCSVGFDKREQQV